MNMYESCTPSLEATWWLRHTHKIKIQWEKINYMPFMLLYNNHKLNLVDVFGLTYLCVSKIS